MKAKLFVMSLLLVLGGIFAQGVLAQDDEGCALTFKATVREGDSAGVALNGTFQFSLDEYGSLTGLLVQEGQPDILVLGQVTGRAINLILDLSTADNPTLLVFGLGTALDPFRAGTCGTILGGSFVGPTEGDSGDWIAASEGGKSRSSVIWGT